MHGIHIINYLYMDVIHIILGEWEHHFIPPPQKKWLLLIKQGFFLK